MRSTQELMRLAITQGAYGRGASTGMGGTCYMCNAVGRLWYAGEITQVEARRVKREIGQYLYELCGDADTLMGVACGKKWVDGPHLSSSSRFHEDWLWAWNVGRVLYWNWDKRPRKTNNE